MISAFGIEHDTSISKATNDGQKNNKFKRNVAIAGAGTLGVGGAAAYGGHTVARRSALRQFGRDLQMFKDTPKQSVRPTPVQPPPVAREKPLVTKVPKPEPGPTLVSTKWSNPLNYTSTTVQPSQSAKHARRVKTKVDPVRVSNLDKPAVIDDLVAGAKNTGRAIRYLTFK